ncbi:hypothetical protein CHU92_11210 [Flavobacterium cyanobacteriorum]|uniref:J domain-containing protein n=1 Tax=Flavobacterium cyanobacteriorum TaxID=2022802 RepID=A0A255Z2F1_9FLAO|nr:DnaJ domain-containing protein [Flavobacterium cyanobacteriorum]OYQ35075.1 hypothetical protein CHU92_11210 [Flavobacterium cyanobacteriorum]
MKDYYKILGVLPGCTQAEIKKAYRLLAVQYHPDKNAGDKASEERFKEIAESYIILGDAAQRHAYDCSKGYKKQHKPKVSATGHTPTGILLMFKKIKEKVFNAGGRINKEMLFKLVDDILTDDTVTFLISAEEILTNNLIIDEIVVCGIFMNAEHKPLIKEKLLVLANGSARMINRISILDPKNPDTL